MKDNSGKIISLLAITRDITERKKSEQKMNELMVDTIDKNNRLQNFAHIVSHNIRSHAANFSGLLEIIKDAKNEDEKKLYFEYLNSSSVKLSETIDNLNEIITIQSNNSLPIEQLELKKEIDKTIKSLNFSILEHHVLIENNISYNVVINSIPAYFDSIILNLITNAIKYRATNRTPIIKISSKVEKDYTILFIEDNGLGIDLEKNGGKLFGMYKTFNGNSDAKGIGLFITKNQIEAMKGKIEVSSKLDVGTTFIIYFKN
jgi:signal transduction histidine kinase